MFFTASAVEVCTGEKFNVNCGPNQVIKAKKAYYGRMSIKSRCVNSNVMGNIGCRTDVLPFIDWLCSGRRTCSSHVPHAKMKLMNSISGACNEDLQSYLEVEYDCLEGNVLLFESNGTRQWRLRTLISPKAIIMSTSLIALRRERATCQRGFIKKKKF